MKPSKKTETNVETITVKANELVGLQSVSGPNKTTSLGYYDNKILNVVGTLDAILRINASFTAYKLYAKPSNVIGCSAEYEEGIGWVGCLGSFATELAFRTAVPTTSAVGFDQAWVLVNGLLQIISTGFVLKNSALPTNDSGSILDAEGRPVGLPSAITGAYPSIASMEGIVSLWDFDEDTGALKVSKVGYPYALRDAGSAQSVRDDTGPMSGHSCLLNGTQNYLRLEAGLVGDLNLSKHGDQCTVVALVYITTTGALQFVAGCWGENNNDPRRQYGLFYNSTTYGGAKAVIGHISKSGGASPNLPYAREQSASQSPVELGRWCVMAMTYDGAEIKSFYDCRWEPRPTYTEPGLPNGEGLTYSKNPFLWSEGLNAGRLSDFAVGANRLTSSWTNYLYGRIGGLAVFKRALTQPELMRVQRVMVGSTLPAIRYTYYNETYSAGTRAVTNISLGWAYYFGTTAQTANTATAWRLEIQGVNRYLGRLASATPSICYDDEAFGIPLIECTKISIRTNNLSTSDLVYPVIKVAGSWYASTTPIQQTVAGISITDFTNEETHEITNLPAELWRLVTLVPGTALSVAGTGAALPTSSLVDAIGVYSPACTAQLVVRDLSLWAPLT